MAQAALEAERLKRLPPYLFAEIDRKKKAAIAAGRDIINLGIGDPDLPTPEPVIEALAKAARDPKNHQYALDRGLPAFRTTVAGWFDKRFGVGLDPDAEIQPTIGSKEAIVNFALAVLNPGDAALVPAPGYPPCRSGVIFAGAEPFIMPLTDENDFYPDLAAVPDDVKAKARLLYLNYPGNPTAKLATREFFERAVKFANDHDMIIAQDMAYSEIAFDGEKPVSIMEIDDGRDIAIEFHSLSKTFNMTGWRIGFAVGNRDAVAALRRIKSNLDSGIFQAIQYAGIKAFEIYDDFVPGLCATYRKRRDVFCDGLNSIGWKVEKPKATFYVWIKLPPGLTSFEVAGRLLDEADIVMIPGAGFGPEGEGYVRATITVTKERLAEAVERIKKVQL